jgi:hypothetical protein
LTVILRFVCCPLVINKKLKFITLLKLYFLLDSLFRPILEEDNVNIALYPELKASDKTFICGNQIQNFVLVNSNNPLAIYNKTTLLYYKITLVFNLIAVDSNQKLDLLINGKKSNDALNSATSSLGTNPSNICEGILIYIR